MKRALLIAVAVVACAVIGFTWIWPATHPTPVLPKGEQTLTGTLDRAPLSLTRRGTHVLTQNGQRLCMVESALVSLDRFESQTVTLHGTFEVNTDPTSLPVLVVRSIDTHPDEFRNETVSSLGLSFAVPADWQRQGTEPAISFTASGTTTSILNLSVAPGTVTPSESNLSVSNHLAKRVMNAQTGSAAIIVQLDGGNILKFQFAPLASDPAAALTRLSQISRTLKLTSSAQGASTSASGTGAVLPCGGTAGILCPKGSYCKITDSAHGVGSCTPLVVQK